VRSRSLRDVWDNMVVVVVGPRGWMNGWMDERMHGTITSCSRLVWLGGGGGCGGGGVGHKIEG